MEQEGKNTHYSMSAADFIQKTDQTNEENQQKNSENYQYMEISGVSLENKSLCGSKFNFSKLSEVVFSGIDFELAEFNFTELDNVKFERCKLDRAVFDYAQMKKVVFENCMMESSSFDFVEGEAEFSICQLSGAEFHHTMASVTMKSCSGGLIELSYSPGLTVNAEDCDFHRGKFIDSCLSGTMKRCVFSDAFFCGTDAVGARFVECSMRDIDISGSRGVDVSGGIDDDEDFEIDFE